MVTLIPDPDQSVDLTTLAKGIHSKLPRYARPLFLRRMTQVGTKTKPFLKVFINVGPPKEDIFLTTYMVYISIFVDRGSVDLNDDLQG